MNEDRFLCIISWTWVIDLSMEWTTLNVTFYIHECERIKLKSVCRVKEDCFGAFHISLSYIIRENSFKLNLNYKYVNFFSISHLPSWGLFLCVWSKYSDKIYVLE